MLSQGEKEEELKGTASNTVQSIADAQAFDTDEDMILDQHCPKELSVMMEMFYVCAIQYSSYKPYMVTEHLKCEYCK